MNSFSAPGAGLKVPDALRDVETETIRRLGKNSDEARIFSLSYLDTWKNSISLSTDAAQEEEFFVVTGDIPAMWLRDSAAQVFPYLAAVEDDEVYAVLSGVLRRQAAFILLDPYANAFNNGPTGAGDNPGDLPKPSPWVWERKYELDSLCYPLMLGFWLWKASGRTEHLGTLFREACRKVLQVSRVEQNHAASPYKFTRPTGPFASDSLPYGGRGAPGAHTGMVRSAFRPSDDRCEFPFLVPSNAMLSVALRGVSVISNQVWNDTEFANECITLADEVDNGIFAFGTAQISGQEILAFETDGMGGTLLADDANLPSLLGLPLLGWTDISDPLYQATRDFILSPSNPYFYKGSIASGVGSPHTPVNFVWPLAIATEGLTGSPASAAEALGLLARTTGGTDRMHESFNVDNPKDFTRPWFGWAAAMYAELALSVTGIDLRQYTFKHQPSI